MENVVATDSMSNANANVKADAGDAVLRVLKEDGALDPAGDPELPDDLVVALHREMNLVRALDARLTSLLRQGRIAAHVGWLGEEAAILGSAAAMRERDRLFPGHFEIGAALWRGMPLAAYVGHVFANEQDPMKGRQIPDWHSRSGAHITQAVGFAWGAKIKRDDVVTLVHFVDAALDSGEFHNGVNFAGVLNVPLVLFCRRTDAQRTGVHRAVILEREGLGREGADREGASGEAQPIDRDRDRARGDAYGIASVRCDGGDLFAVLRATRDAVIRAAEGGGASLVLAVTPHPNDVTHGDRAHDRAHDPIARVRRHLEARNLWNDDAQRELEATLEAEITSAIETAEALGPPPRGTMFDDVYAAPLRHLEEQKREMLAADRPEHAGESPLPRG
jgi:pyruvate dehydrogenase E1 component alpha subunit